MSNFGKHYQGLGRLKRGERNRTEAAYENFLLQQKAVGLIQDYGFESLRLRLADNTFYVPDFVILQADGNVVLHDVKGASHLVTDVARVKLKTAREIHFFDIFLVIPRSKRDGGGWVLEEI